MYMYEKYFNYFRKKYIIYLYCIIFKGIIKTFVISLRFRIVGIRYLRG